MIEGTREGILVEHVMGLGQSNIMNGDFSVNVSLGYKVENGEIVGRVKDAMLAGNVYDALTRIETVGSEAEWTWSMHVPPIKIDALSVVAKG
jgi:PmbA protein